MHYLTLSDIHANLFALRAVLEDAAGKFDQVLCLGDVVGYGPHPNECCELLRQTNARVVVGNHDAAALGWIDPGEWHEIAERAIYWTRERLSVENWAWLGRAGEAVTVQHGEDAPFLITHANLEEPFYETYILDAADAFDTFERLQQSEARLCFFGHTHRAICYFVSEPLHLDSAIGEQRLPKGGTIALQNDTLYLINPGSCGQPRDQNPQARYALFDASAQNVEVRAVSYDVGAARQAIYATSLSSLLGDRLLEGW